MSGSRFVYVTYIRTTREKLWQALTTPEFMKQYWFGVTAETDWKPGSPWKLVLPDGRVADTGEILEAEPPTRLVIKWRNEFKPELKAEGYTRCTMEIAQDGDVAKLTIVGYDRRVHRFDRRLRAVRPRQQKFHDHCRWAVGGIRLAPRDGVGDPEDVEVALPARLLAGHAGEPFGGQVHVADATLRRGQHHGIGGAAQRGRV